MANTSWNYNNDRYLNQVGSGLWGGEPSLILETIQGSVHTFKWMQGGLVSDYSVTIGSAVGRSDIHIGGWLGDVSEYQVAGLPSGALWVRLNYRLGTDPVEYIDMEYTSFATNFWSDAVTWDDNTVWSDA